MFDFNNGNNYNEMFDQNMTSNIGEGGEEPDELGAVPLPNSGPSISTSNPLSKPSDSNKIGTKTRWNIVVRKFRSFRGVEPRKFTVNYRETDGSTWYETQVENHKEVDGKNVQTIPEGWRNFPRYYESHGQFHQKKSWSKILEQARFSIRSTAITFYTNEIMKIEGRSDGETVQNDIVIPFVDGTMESTGLGIVLVGGLILALMGLKG